MMRARSDSDRMLFHSRNPPGTPSLSTWNTPETVFMCTGRLNGEIDAVCQYAGAKWRLQRNDLKIW